MGKLKVLLIDDEQDFLDVMSVEMQAWGYEVVTALDGKAAMDILKKENPDTVIIDYLMPEMDGITLLKEIRTVNKDIPAIMFTAYPNAKAIGGTHKLNVFAFIPKLSVYSDAEETLKTALNMAEKSIHKKG
jgi:DNA-binding NtrC family response regulator